MSVSFGTVDRNALVVGLVAGGGLCWSLHRFFGAESRAALLIGVAVCAIAGIIVGFLT
ncbi:hypothetical protein [uncultured Corynebacterium sp.]|uniref:hypothetical protein n=1 Tax=uncultured Corynebacterium sp. TaxID=159447 RepID=UPI0025F15FDA|nr:hypothetical protein [uncultured Corynebacterium sp.]